MLAKDYFTGDTSLASLVEPFTGAPLAKKSSFGFAPLFASDWERTDLDLDQTHALARTLDYLGLDDAEDRPPLRTCSQKSLSSVKSSSSNSSLLWSDSLSGSTLYYPSSLSSTNSRPLASLNHVRSTDTLISRPSPLMMNNRPRSQTISLEFSDFEDPMTFVCPSDAEFLEIKPLRSLWIGNVDANVSCSELLRHVSPFGKIESIRMVPERESAFVLFEKTEDAVRAKDRLQDTWIWNALLSIGFGNEQDPPSVGPSKSLWVGNLSANMLPHDLEALFSHFGHLETVRLIAHKTYGFVNFIRVQDAIGAKNALDGKKFNGNVLKVGFSKVSVRSPTMMTPPLSEFHPSEFYPTEFYPANYQESSSHSLHSSQGQNGWGYVQMAKKSSSPVLRIPVPFTPDVQWNGPEIQKQNWNGQIETQKDGQNVQKDFKKEEYLAIPPIPEPNPHRTLSQNRLREIRKRLESPCSARDIESLYYEVIQDSVELCSDYIGNVVIQKIIERSSDSQKLKMMQLVGPFLASLGIHKNGTWAVQKIIDCAKTPAQMNVISVSIRPYTPALLLDQFGNYVVQCCLKLTPNQFVFDAVTEKIWDIGQGRFGARAIRTLLESSQSSKRQQKQVAMAIAQYGPALSMNPNGAILVTWLMDSSLPGRYHVLAPKLAPHIGSLAIHKLAGGILLKLVNQQVEPDAREVILRSVFYTEPNLIKILSDSGNGLLLLIKILNSSSIPPGQRSQLADMTRNALGKMKSEGGNYKRLHDELALISPHAPVSSDPVSPLTPCAPYFQQHPDWYPTPSRS